MDGMLLSEIPTPSFVVNRKRVLANCQRMLNYCKAHNVQLRPHMKTHKCVEVARMMTEGVDNRPITVSTLVEAELFASNGFKDILFAHYALDKTRIDRLHALIAPPTNAVVHVFVDSEAGLAVLEKNPPPNASKKWSVYFKVDCGYGRGGAVYDAESTIKLARKIANGPATTLYGLYAHDGNAYYAKAPGEAVETGRITGERLVEVLNKIGINKKLVVAIGATPSCFSYPACEFTIPPGVTELHPGAYVFCDTQQAIAIGACEVGNIACSVATRIVGHYPTKGHILIDAGFTALSHDLGRIEGSNKDGVTTPRLSVNIVGHPELTVVRVTQEVGIVRALNETSQPLDFSKYPVGSVLFVQPYHCCATADKYLEYYVTDDDVHIEDKWIPVRGW